MTKWLDKGDADGTHSSLKSRYGIEVVVAEMRKMVEGAGIIFYSRFNSILIARSTELLFQLAKH